MQFKNFKLLTLCAILFANSGELKALEYKNFETGLAISVAAGLAIGAKMDYEHREDDKHLENIKLNLSILPKLNFKYADSDLSENKINFKYQDLNSDYLSRLQSLYNIKKEQFSRYTQLELVIIITNLVHNLWEHDGNNMPAKSDPISILEEVLVNKKKFRCVEYSTVLAGCLNAVGINCRVLRLRTKDVETREYGAGHVVVEAYLYGKWIMIDPQAKWIPACNGNILNAVEFQQALANKEQYKSVYNYFDYKGREILAQFKNDCPSFEEYAKFIGQYLYYFETVIEQKNYDNNQPSVMLVPIDAPNPTIFQKKYPLDIAIYTHSVASFYQKPDILNS